MIDELLEKEIEEVRKQQQNGSLGLSHLVELADNDSPLGAYPIIKIFLNFDVLDFLNVISMTFNEPSFEAVIGLEKKQQVVDVLIEIGLSRTSNGSTGGVSYSTYNNQLVGHLFTFLARQIANKNNNIQVDNSIFTQVQEIFYLNRFW
jgi:hypothetical protein